MRKIFKNGLGLFALLACLPAAAQFNLDGQYVLRTEYRNGYNKLIQKGVEPAAFIAHRARLQASYTKDAFTFYTSIQDIRTWGNTAQTKLTDNNLSVHEAYLEAKLNNQWKIKLGRQELNYDNARFLGNLDWALQARAHDFALVKYEKGKANFQLGGGFNQDAQQLTGNTFTTPNQYKVAQMARYENVLGKLQYSVLFWNDGRQYTQTNTSGAVVKKGVRYRQTIGLPTLKYQSGNTSLSGFYYQQLGRDVIGRKMNGFDASAQVSHLFTMDSAASRKFRITGGYEVLSGTKTNSADVNKSFSPLYGTNHMHNGYMDLFYVGGAHENSVGLQDYFVRNRYEFNAKLFTQLDGHLFSAYANTWDAAGKKMDKYLGTELDLTVGYLFNNAISLQGGYSQFFQSGTFEQVQNKTAVKGTQNWAYLMLIFRPNMKNKFIGLLQ